MASALDLVAAVGQTFGERPEAVRALPRPPDAAFVLCALALTWACLWRGAVRWFGLVMFAASVAMYVAAPRPIIAFDGDARAIYARGDHAWTLIAASGRSTYARDRLGAMLGISPPAIERLAPPEACGEGGCLWRRGEQAYAFVADESGFARACAHGAVVIARVPAPEDLKQRCGLAALIDDLGAQGGGLIYERAGALRIIRALTPGVQRPWTPRGVVQE